MRFIQKLYTKFTFKCYLVYFKKHIFYKDHLQTGKERKKGCVICYHLNRSYLLLLESAKIGRDSKHTNTCGLQIS